VPVLEDREAALADGPGGRVYPRLVYFQGLHRQQSIKAVPLPSHARFHQIQENPDGKGSRCTVAWLV